MNETKLYAWQVKANDRQHIIVLALASNPDDAVDKIMLNSAATISDGDRLIQIEERLRFSSPVVVDFSGGAGVLELDPTVS